MRVLALTDRQTGKVRIFRTMKALIRNVDGISYSSISQHFSKSDATYYRGSYAIDRLNVEK